MRARLLKRTGALLAVVAAVASSSCANEFTREGRAPTQLTIMSILTASTTTGAVPTTFVNGPLLSDVRNDEGTIFDDFAQVTLRNQFRDIGAPGAPAAPSQLNDVTVTRFRVTYRRADGRNVPGVDVPHGFDGALTLTVPAGSTAIAVIELVRHVAKAEAPLSVLGNSFVVLTTIADVTFYGRDQAGNEVSAAGSVQINFANYGG